MKRPARDTILRVQLPLVNTSSQQRLANAIEPGIDNSKNGLQDFGRIYLEVDLQLPAMYC